MKKVLIIHPYLDTRGGAERKLSLIAKNLKDSYEVEIITFKYDKEETFKEYLEGVKVTSYSNSKKLIPRILNFPKILSKCKEADLLFAHNFPANVIAALAKVRYSKKILWFCNEPVPFLAKKSKVNEVIKRIDKWAAKKADIIVANSSYTKGLIKDAYNLNSEVIYSGVEDSLFTLKKKKHKVIIISSVGRFKKHKNFEDLIKIAEEINKKYPEVKWILCGTRDDHHKEIERLSKGKKYIEVVYTKNRSETFEIYKKTDIVAFSPKNEPLGMIPLEAMACSIPVVAFNSGGPKETIKNNVTGYLCENRLDMTEKVEKLIKSEKLRDKIGVQGRKYAKERYSMDNMLSKTLKNIKKLI